MIAACVALRMGLGTLSMTNNYGFLADLYNNLYNLIGVAIRHGWRILAVLIRRRVMDRSS